MDGKELYQQLVNFGELDVPETTVAGWINTAQQEVSIEVPVVNEKTLTNVVENYVMSTTDGAIEVISAVYEDGDYPLSSIEINGKNLIFRKAATILTFKYTSTAPVYSSLDQSLSINPSFHAFILYYLIGMYYDMEGEGDEEESALAERFNQRWVYYRQQTVSSLRATGNVASSTGDPQNTTDAMPIRARRSLGEDYYE